MNANGLMSHVAMSVDRATFNDAYIDDLSFYLDLLGWRVSEKLSIKNERLLLSLPTEGQYINIRARDEAMVTTDYEHMGVYVESADKVHELYQRVEQQHAIDSRVELDDRGVQLLYGGTLTTFRFKYLLPLAIEVQHLSS